jgi:oxygen-dependent protoporphyrinogen oxidase
LFGEPFIGKSRREESAASFVRRRLGHEFLDYAADPFIAGIYAGDPEKLSARHTFPKLSMFEEQHGSLLKGMMFAKKEPHGSGKLFSFKEGMRTFPDRIAGTLGNALKYECTVERVIPMRAGKYPVYTISYLQNDTRHSIEADAVIFATPAYNTAEIIRPIDPTMATTLTSVVYPPLAEIFLGFKKNQIHQLLDGFGFLVPNKEQRAILGTIWSSTLFPHRAPDNCVALTAFVGGTRQPELASSGDTRLIELVMKELRSLMNITGDPIFTHTTRWERAIPQYNLGYGTLLKAIERFEQNFHGAFICANYRGGVSVGDCVKNARLIADRIIGNRITTDFSS